MRQVNSVLIFFLFFSCPVSIFAEENLKPEEESFYEELFYDEVVAEETVAEETVAEETVAEETVTEETVAEETVTEETVAEETVAEETVAEETVTEETVTEETVTEETVAEETVAEETVAEETVAEETVAEETVAEEMVAEEMVVEKPVSREAATLAAEIMEKSGINSQLEMIPGIIKSDFIRAQKQSTIISSAVAMDVVQIINAAFYPGKLQLTLKKGLEAGLNEEEVKFLLQWFESPLGQTITALEAKSSSRASVNRMLALKNELQKTTYGVRRIELVKGLNEVIKSTEFAVNMILNVQIATSMAMLSIISPADDAAHENVLNQILMTRPELEKSMDEQIFLRYLYLYRVLKNSEIDAYITFAETAAGQKFNQIISTSLTEAMTSAGRETGNAIGEYLKSKSTR